MNDPMILAELAQARRIAASAMGERETYVRMCAILCEAITTGTVDALHRVDGHVAIRRKAFDEVPKKYRIDVKAAEVKDPLAPENEPGEQVLVVIVGEAKEPDILTPASRVIVPNGRV